MFEYLIIITLQGSPQWITIDFEQSIIPVDLSIQFQGGFAGGDCWIEGKMDTGSTWEKIEHFYPEDKNSLQVSLLKFQLFIKVQLSKKLKKNHSSQPPWRQTLDTNSIYVIK